jgi:hypothetical protein
VRDAQRGRPASLYRRQPGVDLYQKGQTPEVRPPQTELSRARNILSLSRYRGCLEENINITADRLRRLRIRGGADAFPPRQCRARYRIRWLPAPIAPSSSPKAVMVMDAAIWAAAAADITMAGRAGDIGAGTNPRYRILKEAASGDGLFVLYPRSATLALAMNCMAARPLKHLLSAGASHAKPRSAVNCGPRYFRCS